MNITLKKIVKRKIVKINSERKSMIGIAPEAYRGTFPP